MQGITPHIVFTGNCKEIINFYKESLSGEIVKMFPYKGSPIEAPEEHQDKIMHVEFRFGDNVIIGADAMPEAEVVQGNNIQFSVDCKDLEEAKQYFKNLSQGGKVIMEMQETFWGAMFGMVEDKYGFQWMFNVALQKQS